MFLSNLVLFLLIGGLLDNIAGVCYNPTQTEYDGQSHVCVSITEFKLLSKKKVPDGAKLFKCPDGQVCVDESEICVDSAKAQAACSNPSKCKVCLNDAKYACISAMEFVPCNNKAPLSEFIQKCPSSQYCGFPTGYDKTEYPCTEDVAEQACRMESSPQSPESGQEITSCKKTGAQAIKSDLTCKSYFYCSLSNGVLTGKKYVCPGNYVFHPSTKKCVSKSQYKCSTASD